MTARGNGGRAPAPGVNVAGFLRGGLGLGEAARLYVGALQAAGVPVGTTTVEVPLPDAASGSVAAVRKEVEFGDLEAGTDTPINLICVNGPELRGFAREVGPDFFAGRRSIGVWGWEVDRLPPEWTRALPLVDEIWVYSRYVADIFARETDVPVIRAPLPVTAPPTDSAPADLGLPDRFTFLFLFDFYSTLKRKNPLGLIEAFKRAFRPGEGPQLLIKSFNGDFKPERLALLEAAAREHADVHVIDRYLTPAQKSGLMRRADCYVSLHRAEGYGLTMAEAMALGRPTIATGFSGNLDFMTPDNSYLVGHELTEVGPGGDNYPASGIWAEPDLDHAAELMRSVWADPDAARERAERGREFVERELSPGACGAVARERLEWLAANGQAAEGAAAAQAAAGVWSSGSVEHAHAKLGHDPLADAQREGGGRGAARGAVLRAMRPYTYHQDELNGAVVRALSELEERISELTAENQARERQLAGDDLKRVIDAVRARPAPTHPLITEPDGRGELRLGFRVAPGEEGAGAYRSFEDIFRGDEQLIRQRQERYAEMLEGRSSVIDLGCGRGEFLDVLRAREVSSRGVDLDAGMVARAEEKGHDVICADALDFLREQADESIPAVFAAQVVEHLAPDVLNELLRLLAVKLEPGGVAVLETMNPHSPRSMKAFWVDPTHHHPLFPEVLLALCRLAGFGAGQVMLTEETGEFSRDILSSPDYAVVATAREEAQ